MKKTFKRTMSTLLLTTILSTSLMPMSVLAKYDRSVAKAYALEHSENENMKKKIENKDKKYYNHTYYIFSSDCTNFVSQCEVHAGIWSYRPSKLPSDPLPTRDYKLDTDADAWYMIKRKRTIFKDYWLYSKSWACVTDFRKYFGKSNNAYSNACASVVSYRTINDKGVKVNRDTIKNRLQIGDVVQYDENGHAHSIIITEKNGTDVKYSAHTTDYKNRSLNDFFKAADAKNISRIWIIHFS